MAAASVLYAAEWKQKPCILQLLFFFFTSATPYIILQNKKATYSTSHFVSNDIQLTTQGKRENELVASRNL